MSYLIDTDYVARYLKGQEEGRGVVGTLLRGKQRLAISLITYGEIYEGIYYGRDPQSHERVFQQFLRAVRVLPLTQPIMRRFALLRGDLRSRGQIISDPDLLIAATALHHNLALVTGNLRHFERIAALQLHPSS